MPRRRWDDPWQRYPASVPRPAEGGLATSRQRGPMAETWWSHRFVEVLESYGLGTRMQRGRRYARTGQVLSLEVQTAVISAQVQGSRRTPYLVTLSLAEPTAAQWHAINKAMTAKVGFVARLLAGEVSPDLEDVFQAAGVPLFPASWRDLRARCSCPDWENPCKHIAAVLYILADQLDTDPWLLLRWRAATRSSSSSVGAAAPAQHQTRSPPGGPSPPAPYRPSPPPSGTSIIQPIDPDTPDAVLDRLEADDITVAGRPLRDVLRPGYDQLSTPEDPHGAP